MKMLAEIKYKKDNETLDYQLMAIVITIIISIFTFLLIRSIEAVVICCSIILLEFIFLGKKGGTVKVYEERGGYVLSIADKGKSDIHEKVSSYKFRWSYNYFTFMKSDVGTPKATHVNYIFTRVEFTLENGKRVTLGKELNQWNSTPANWEYEVLNQEGSEFLGITSHNLVKLKKAMEADI